MIFFGRSSSSTAFSIWQPKNARQTLGDKLVCISNLQHYQNFPELLAAVRQAAWQPVIQDEACEMPPAGEDYRGAACTGRLIAPAYQLAAIRTGEDYRRELDRK